MIILVINLTTTAQSILTPMSKEHDIIMAPQTYSKVVNAITSKKLKEPFVLHLTQSKFVGQKTPIHLDKYLQHTDVEIQTDIRHYSYN